MGLSWPAFVAAIAVVTAFVLVLLLVAAFWDTRA